MTLSEVRDHLVWADEQGNVWVRLSYCEEPTVTFERVWPQLSADDDCKRLSGAVGCMLVSDLRPLALKERP